MPSGVRPQRALDVVGAVDNRDSMDSRVRRLGQGVQLFCVDDIDAARGKKIEDLLPNRGQGVPRNGGRCRARQPVCHRGETRARSSRYQVWVADPLERVSGLVFAVGAGCHQFDAVPSSRECLDGVVQHQTAAIDRWPGGLCRHDEDAERFHHVDPT